MSREEILRAGLEGRGLKPSGGQVAAFMLYLDELKRWSRAYSLTSLRTDEDIIIKHFVDSCLYFAGIEAEEGIESIADVGSGAGFPGLPMKIMRPELRVFLIEPVGKKATFLGSLIRKLGLDGVEVLRIRVEDVKDLLVDAALTRALFTPWEFYHRCGHIVRRGGLLIMSKGPKAEAELEGLAVPAEIKEVSLPLTSVSRRLLIMRKE